MTKTKQATYRGLYFPALDRWVALCWNYDQAVLLSTTDHASYRAAKAELEAIADRHGVSLRWYDGCYAVVNGQMEDVMARC